MTTSKIDPHLGRHYNKKKYGPGNWDALHTIALHCDENNTPETFLEVFKIIVFNFKCMSCRPHAIKYYKQHPPEVILYKYTFDAPKSKFDNNSLRNKYPCSYYINLFHNTVNHRLGKQLYDLSESIKLTKGVCNQCVI